MGKTGVTKKTGRAAGVMKNMKAETTKRQATQREGRGKSAETTAWLQKGKLTSTGQYELVSNGCISTGLDGKPCPRDRAQVHIPYCKTCRKSGDPSLRPMQHPKYGKILIANRNLKKGYRVAWWGDRMAKKKLPHKHWEWALESHIGVIDAVPHPGGSLLQFSACPGPTERPTIDFDPKNKCLLLCREPQAGLIFNTLCDIPKNHQVTMMYNKDEKSTNEFFAERGLTRADVGTAAYPALQKKPRGGAKK